MVGRRSASLLTLLALPLNNYQFLRAYADKKGEGGDNDDFTTKTTKVLADTFRDIAKASIHGIDAKLLMTSVSNGDYHALSTYTHDFFESPIPGKIGFGFAMGFSSGYFLKQSAKFVAFAAGGMFTLVQVLSSNGYVKVNYERLTKDFENAFDMNNDGKLDEKDFQIAYQKVS